MAKGYNKNTDIELQIQRSKELGTLHIKSGTEISEENLDGIYKAMNSQEVGVVKIEHGVDFKSNTADTLAGMLTNTSYVSIYWDYDLDIRSEDSAQHIAHATKYCAGLTIEHFSDL